MGQDDKFELDTLYMAAVMRVHHELHWPGSDGFADRFSRTLLELGIDQGVFDHFLSAHREELVRTCREVGIV